MQKGTCAVKVLGKERLGTLRTQREQEGMVKNIFFTFVMTWIYAQPNRVYERDAIRAFFAKYELTESDWDEDSAVRAWRRYKHAVACSSPKLVEKIKPNRKISQSRQVFGQMLNLFSDVHFLMSFREA